MICLSSSEPSFSAASDAVDARSASASWKMTLRCRRRGVWPRKNSTGLKAACAGLGSDSSAKRRERDLHWRPATSASTIVGSARVDVSPKPSVAPSAILRRMRRMILPERVFGQRGRELDFLRRGERADVVAHLLVELLAQLVVAFLARIERDEGVDRLALDVVRVGDHRRFGDLGVRRPASFRPRRCRCGGRRR